MSSTDVVLEPPKDTISSLSFSNDSTRLLVSSWDGSLLLHDITSYQAVAPTKYQHPAAVLDACFSSESTTAFSGGLDRRVRSWDLATNTATVLGQHDEAVKSVVWSSEANVLITGGWDSRLNVYDPRAATPLVASHELPSRVYSMDTKNDKLVVAMAERNVYVYDVRKLDEPEQKRESALKYMTRKVACMTDGKGWTSCSIEGRIAVDYFSPEDQAKKYAYRCHRATVDGQDVVYPINALAYHPLYNSFCSGGSDATVSIWDQVAKKRMKAYPKFANSISALACSPDGTWLAVGYGYGWDEGELPADEGASKGEVGCLLRAVGDDVKPKVKA